MSTMRMKALKKFSTLANFKDHSCVAFLLSWRDMKANRMMFKLKKIQEIRVVCNFPISQKERPRTNRIMIVEKPFFILVYSMN